MCQWMQGTWRSTTHSHNWYTQTHYKASSTCNLYSCSMLSVPNIYVNRGDHPLNHSLNTDSWEPIPTRHVTRTTRNYMWRERGFGWLVDAFRWRECAMNNTESREAQHNIVTNDWELTAINQRLITPVPTSRQNCAIHGVNVHDHSVSRVIHVYSLEYNKELIYLKYTKDCVTKNTALHYQRWNTDLTPLLASNSKATQQSLSL